MAYPNRYDTQRRQEGVKAGRRYAKTSKATDPQLYSYLTTLGARSGTIAQRKRANQSVTRRKQLLSSLSRRTTETSRQRVLNRALAGYGLRSK